MREIVVAKADAGQRFDKYLIKFFPNTSSGFLYKMLRKKNITLNNSKSDGKDMIKEGDVVKVFFSDETFDKFHGKASVSSNNRPNNSNKQLDMGISVLLETDDLVFMNKPAGVLSQKDATNQPSVNEWLNQYLLQKQFDPGNYKPGVCNRLDRNTSGIIIGAKTYRGSRFMFDMISNHRLHKYYDAICTGVIDKELLLKGYIKKDSSTNKVQIHDHEVENSDYIETRIIPVNTNGSISYVNIELITGKTHQIRAHMASIGHPLIGDVKYGGPKLKGHTSQLLHSCKVVFPKMEDDEYNLSQRIVENHPKWLKEFGFES